MRLAIDIRTLNPHFPGIGRYIGSLTRALLDTRADDEQIILLAGPHPSADPFAATTRRVAGSPFSLRQQWSIPHALRVERAELYHSPYYLMPYRPGVRTVLTVYDLIPLQHPGECTPAARLFFRWATTLALRAASRVIAISDATRRELLARFPIAPSRVSVIPLAAGEEFRRAADADTAAARRRWDLPDDFLLYLGSDKPHKNLARLQAAWAELPEPRPPLVWAGPQTSNVSCSSGLRRLGHIPDPELPALYSAATAFVFPSLAEGFGLPALEAMACGVPCVCADIPALREWAADAALYFKPLDERDMRAKLRLICRSAELRAQLAAAGLRRAALFSWRRTAELTRQIYQETLTANGG